MTGLSPPLSCCCGGMAIQLLFVVFCSVFCYLCALLIYQFCNTPAVSNISTPRGSTHHYAQIHSIVLNPDAALYISWLLQRLCHRQSSMGGKQNKAARRFQWLSLYTPCMKIQVQESFKYISQRRMTIITIIITALLLVAISSSSNTHAFIPSASAVTPATSIGRSNKDSTSFEPISVSKTRQRKSLQRNMVGSQGKTFYGDPHSLTFFMEGLYTSTQLST